MTPRLLATHFLALGPGAECGTREYIRRHSNHLSGEQSAHFEASISTMSPARLRGVFRSLANAGARDVIAVPMIADLDPLNRLADVLGPEVDTA